jgi:hypothetical protein
VIAGQDAAKWALRDQQFKQLINQEIELLFREPGRIEKAIDLEGDGLPEQEMQLLDFLASKVVESQPTATEDALGFTRVIDFLADLKKPLISHNGIMDLMFLYDKFYRPLPETQTEFKAGVNGLFPHIYDTKHMVNARQELQ